MRFAIVSALIVAVAFAPLATMLARDWLKKRKAAKEEDADPSAPIIEMIALTLEDHPTDWVSDDYRLNHAALKISIWVANGKDYLNVRIDGQKAGSSLSHDGIKPKGSARTLLWKAVKRHRAWLTEREVQAFAERVVTVLGKTKS